ncbi:MAG TPA: sigma-54 dependent transcriptional regulator [Polyangiaceae bacterium]|jgi:two-component system response regulator AtoC|nr:sigma-54 dependent transcriptional regulator [Polyangiaceae bacterium]
MAPQPGFLIASADDANASALEAMLFESGARGQRVKNIEEALAALDFGSYDVLIADATVTDFSAGTLSAALAQRGHELALIALVEGDRAADGAAAVRAGAADFLRKPVERDEVAYVLGKALQSQQPSGDEPPRSRVFAPTVELLGQSEPMQDLQRTLRRAANGIATVLVRGESGTGKELVARLVHEYSPRRGGPYVKVHCAALPDQLLESELFGYERGAFTGATARKPGRVELAEGGTLFLDEIGDISPATQVKLLRVLQDRRYERLGGTETLSADVRFVTATHRDLEALVREGKFREDLFYRLNVVALWVPPLRARKTDIETLAVHFCSSVAAANSRRAPAFDADALSLLVAEAWPGNVRQLQNVVERLVVLTPGPRISARDVNRELSQKPGTLAFAVSSGFAPEIDVEQTAMELQQALRKAERRAIDRAMTSAAGDKNLAARLLGISRRSLYYKLEEHGL